MASDTPPSSDPGPIEARRRQELERRRLHSRRIQFWRRTLPIVIVGIAGLLVLWIGGRSLIVKLASGGGPRSAGVRMVNPRFYGRDTANRAYVLGAAEASRDMSDERKVTLAAPNVTLDAGGANPTHVEALHGIYREDQRELSLQGKVQVTDGRGYSFTTPTARVDTTTGRVSGESGVQGQGPLGQIAASSYGVYDRGQTIIMRGDVRAHIVQ